MSYDKIYNSVQQSTNISTNKQFSPPKHKISHFARQSRRYNPDIPQHQCAGSGGGGESPCRQWAFGTLTARSRLTGGIPTFIQIKNIYGFVNTILSQIITSISIKLHRVYKCQLANMNWTLNYRSINCITQDGRHTWMNTQVVKSEVVDTKLQSIVIFSNKSPNQFNFYKKW